MKYLVLIFLLSPVLNSAANSSIQEFLSRPKCFNPLLEALGKKDNHNVCLLAKEILPKSDLALTSTGESNKCQVQVSWKQIPLPPALWDCLAINLDWKHQEGLQLADNKLSGTLSGHTKDTPIEVSLNIEDSLTLTTSCTFKEPLKLNDLEIKLERSIGGSEEEDDEEDDGEEDDEGPESTIAKNIGRSLYCEWSIHYQKKELSISELEGLGFQVELKSKSQNDDEEEDTEDPDCALNPDGRYDCTHELDDSSYRVKLTLSKNGDEKDSPECDIPSLSERYSRDLRSRPFLPDPGPRVRPPRPTYYRIRGAIPIPGIL